MLENIKNYIIPKTYNINITDKIIYINNYTKINNITDNNINIETRDTIINIIGEKISVMKILDNEILFKAKTNKVEINYK